MRCTFFVIVRIVFYFHTGSITRQYGYGAVGVEELKQISGIADVVEQFGIAVGFGRVVAKCHFHVFLV